MKYAIETVQIPTSSVHPGEITRFATLLDVKRYVHLAPDATIEFHRGEAQMEVSDLRELGHALLDLADILSAMPQLNPEE